MVTMVQHVEGFGDFHYDNDVYNELMKLSKAELVARELDGTIFKRTAVRGLRKSLLAVLVAHRETARREWMAEANTKPGFDTSVSESMAKHAAFDMDTVGQPVEQVREIDQDVTLALVADVEAGPEDVEVDDDHRDGCECSDCLEFGDAMDVLDAKVEATHDADADAELLSFMRTVVEAPSLPPAFPVTETDVAVAEVYIVVQLRGRLYDGKLISVVNRRTTLSPALLVTVELEDGIRRLVRADHTLAA